MGIGGLSVFAGLMPDMMTGGTLHVRIDAPNGREVATVDLVMGNQPSVRAHETTLAPTDGVHDLYFVFGNEDEPDAMDPVAAIAWLAFDPVE